MRKIFLIIVALVVISGGLFYYKLIELKGVQIYGRLVDEGSYNVCEFIESYKIVVMESPSTPSTFQMQLVADGFILEKNSKRYVSAYYSKKYFFGLRTDIVYFLRVANDSDLEAIIEGPFTAKLKGKIDIGTTAYVSLQDRWKPWGFITRWLINVGILRD